MSRASTVFIDGMALWAPSLPGWDVARSAFRGEGVPASALQSRPAAELLPPAERRRAPDSVVLALEVAARAVQQSGFAAAELLSVFASAHGDLGITDYVCSTLVSSPQLLSPIKFHNSVHNAAAGYWTIGTACMQASTSVSAYLNSFAAGLMEALVQCAALERPVLFVGYDIEARGALASINASRGMLGVALVLCPNPSPRSVAALQWAVAPGESRPVSLCSSAASALSGNAMADALAFFEALAQDRREAFRLPLAAQLSLQLQLGLLA